MVLTRGTFILGLVAGMAPSPAEFSLQTWALGLLRWGLSALTYEGKLFTQARLPPSPRLPGTLLTPARAKALIALKDPRSVLVSLPHQHIASYWTCQLPGSQPKDSQGHICVKVPRGSGTGLTIAYKQPWTGSDPGTHGAPCVHYVIASSALTSPLSRISLAHLWHF
jgi:hypothetical protein